jgi:hypothetical protein
MTKKTTLKELGEMIAHVVKHMATKDDLSELETRLDGRIDKLDARLTGVESNLSGQINRIDTKSRKRACNGPSLLCRRRPPSAA